MLKSLRRSLSERYGWRLYTRRVLWHRKIWDFLCRNKDVSRIQSDGTLFFDRVPAPLLDDPILQNPDIISRSWYMDVFTAPTEEYVYRIDQPAVIEPRYGYVILKPHSLLDTSLPRSEATRDPAKMLDFSGLPSLWELYGRHRNAGSKCSVIRVPAVISLRYTHEANYYHVLQDILSRLKMFDDCGVDRTLPIVISRTMAESTFFAQMRMRGDLRNRNWLVQDGNYIETEQVFVARAAEGNRARLMYLTQLLDAPQPDPAQMRRVFIARDGKRYGRGILNIAELRPLLTRYGYEIIDPQAMTIADQMQTFSESRFVIGAHGAGLTNIIYRGCAPLTLLEIFPPNETPLHFYVIARAFGYDYRYMSGQHAEGQGRTVSFHVDPELLEKQLADLHKIR